MNDEIRDISPETADRITHARSLSNRAIADRMVDYRNIGALLVDRAAQTPDKNWLTFIDGAGQATFTYAEFLDAARRVAAMMQQQLGIEPGQRVATLLVNDPRTVLIYFGAWLIGATVVPINTAEDDTRVSFILENSGAKALFALSTEISRADSIASQVPSVQSVVSVDTTIPGTAHFPLPAARFDQSVAAHHPIPDLPDIGPDTECVIVYTSGTTGAPKGVVLEHYNLLVDAKAIAEWHRFGPDDRAMCVLPIHHVNGTVVTLMTPLYSAGSVVLNRRFRAQSFWQTVEEQKCTWVSVVPTVLAFLCEHYEDVSSRDMTHFRHIICGAGPLTTELASRFHERFSVRIVHGYGLSETTCYSCFLPIDLGPAEYSSWMMERGFPSIGCPLPVNEMAIHDPTGHAIGPEERGEIVIRGHNVMRWYFQRPDSNRDAFAHGWFRTGDEGYYSVGVDGRSYFFITGRMKELIIRGGVNYSPFDIDEVLCSIPGIKAAMAVGFESRFYGEEVGAYVQLEEGATLTEADILAACRTKLSFAKSPKVIVFGTAFPVTSTGKYRRLDLKHLFEEWRDTDFRSS